MSTSGISSSVVTEMLIFQMFGLCVLCACEWLNAARWSKDFLPANSLQKHFR